MTAQPRQPTSPVHVAQRVGDLAKTHADHPAIVSRDERWTYRQLHQKTDQLAAAWRKRGLKPGDRVASLMPNSPELLIHYLACLKAGLVATPLNYRFATPEIDHALKVTEAAVLLCHGERTADVRASAYVRQLPAGVVWHRPRTDEGDTFEELLDGPRQDVDLPPADPSDPSFIFFTSGSTGMPKGVTHSHETLGWILASLHQAFELTEQDVVLPGSSMSHIGASGMAMGALTVPCTVVVARTLDAPELLNLLREYRPTVLVMLPAALTALERDHGATHDDFASLRMCLSGGDKVPLQLEHEIAALADLKLIEGYGMTEIGFAAMNPPAGVIKAGSVGKPCPGFRFQLRGSDGSTVEPTEGRLWVKSRSNMLGYWNAPQATAEVMRDGWVDTGDLMRVDEDGYYWFFGRKKQLIVHDGSNIAPQEVEEALLNHLSVESAGVVGVRSPLHGETVRAYITLRSGSSRPTDQELLQVVRSKIAAYKAPEEVMVLDKMPLNATGKVDRAELKRLANSGDLNGECA